MNRRIAAPGRPLSPRFAALLRESWWLLVVALLAYLALVLATYARSDAGWSYSGNGNAIVNKGGVVGAWIADLLLYLFGASAWWWVFAGAILVVAGFHRLTSRGHDRDFEPRHHPWLAVPGFACVLLASAALEALRLYRMPATLPQGPGGAMGQFFGGWLSKALGFNGATLLLIACSRSDGRSSRGCLGCA
jgi:S-DNA-T family DNA segregation ATPase FtsK/SpoIIIE